MSALRSGCCRWPMPLVGCHHANGRYQGLAMGKRSRQRMLIKRPSRRVGYWVAKCDRVLRACFSGHRWSVQKSAGVCTARQSAVDAYRLAPRAHGHAIEAVAAPAPSRLECHRGVQCGTTPLSPRPGPDHISVPRRNPPHGQGERESPQRGRPTLIPPSPIDRCWQVYGLLRASGQRKDSMAISSLRPMKSREIQRHA